MFDLLLSAVVTGLLVGMFYALIASGLNLIFGVMRVVNLAHGDFVLLGAFAAFWLWTWFGIAPLTSLVFVVPAFFILGVVLYYTNVPRLQTAEDTEMMSLIFYFGLAITLMSLMRILWGSQTRAIQRPYEDVLPVNVSIGELTIVSTRLVGALLALVTMVVMVWFLYNTYYGKAVRALIQNREATKFLGIDTHRVSAISFGIGMSLAGIAGVALTLIFPAFDAGSGLSYTIVAFAIIVLGGLGDPIGAMIAGVVFAIIEQVAMIFLPLTAAPIVAFLILIAIIMVRPEGIFRTETLRDYGLPV